MITEPDIMNLLTQIADPEIPVINIVELGIIRNIKYENELITIDITPTYSACPAIEMIRQEISSKLVENHILNFKINMTYSPAWTTDWISEDGLMKLKKYGITPPSRIDDTQPLEVYDTMINCPFCNSQETELKSYFGSTACKSLYYCNNCEQPFEYFKKF